MIYFGEINEAFNEKDFVVEIKKKLLKHGYVTKAELYELLGCTPSPVDGTKGWTDLDSMEVRKCGDSEFYYVILPDPETLYLYKKHSRKKNNLDTEGFYLYAAPFESYEDVESILDVAKEMIYLYGYITVCDLYDLMGIDTEYTDALIGWTDLSNAYVVKDDHELITLYLCHVPEPYPIPDKIGTPDTKEYLNAKLGTVKLEENDLVNHPQHYKSKSGLEVIDAIEAFTEDLQGIEAVDTANIIKYICRWKKKNGLQDLEKAQWYLNNLIEYVKENE